MKEEKFLAAAEDGDIKTITDLLGEGVSVDTKDEHDRTALMKAVKHEREDIVKLLIERGADVNARDNRGTNAIYWAAVKGNLAITAALIQANADASVHDDRGWTALDHAKSNHKTEIARMLEAAGEAV